jgi:cobalt/nickel transport system permease protein
LRIDLALFDIRRLDELGYQDSPVHRLDPRAKVLTTLAFVVAVVSFHKYTVSALLPFLLFPVGLGALGRLPPGYLLKKILLVAPFALMVGAANPFFDQEPLVRVGPLTLSGGWVSYGSILLRFVLTIGAALVLIATTSFSGVCLALVRLGVPKVLAIQLLFLYRYLFVLTEEATRLVRARALRSFHGKGMGFRVFAGVLGNLLLRTMDRAQRIHLAMLCRGFDGEIRLANPLRLRAADVAYTAACLGGFTLFRVVDVPRHLGQLLLGGVT